MQNKIKLLGIITKKLNEQQYLEKY